MTNPDFNSEQYNWDLAQTVETLHPGITVQRDEVGALHLDIHKGGVVGNPREVERRITVDVRIPSHDRGPDLSVLVYDEAENYQPTSQYFVKASQGRLDLEHESGQEVNAGELWGQVRSGYEIFDAYLGLPDKAQRAVSVAKCYDKVRSRAGLQDALGAAGLNLNIRFMHGDETLTPTEVFTFFGNTIPQVEVQ